MGFFDKVKRAFGGAAEAAEAVVRETTESSTVDAVVAGEDSGEEELSAAQEEWREKQALIAQVEGSGVSLAGIDPADPITFWTTSFQYEAHQGEGLEQDEAAQRIGFSDREHWDLVSSYVGAKWSVLTTDEDGDEVVAVKDEFTNAAMKARMAQMQGAQAAAAAADPTLLAPVDGVSVDQWAGASAGLSTLGADATPQQAAEVLARFGLDQAKYDAANAGWQAKMQGDTTGAIATKFGAAFTQGAASMGVAGAGAAAAGEAPCTFEKFVEVMAAQSAWAEQGLDVQAQLQSTFGIEIATYSAWSAYWSPKMGTDIALAQKYTKLDEQYKAKYAGAPQDDDLSF